MRTEDRPLPPQREENLVYESTKHFYDKSLTRRAAKPLKYTHIDST